MGYQHSIANIVEALKITSSNTFSFADKYFTADAHTAANSFATPGADPLTAVITNIIYQQGYCRVFNGSYYEQSSITADNKEFLASLSASNATVERWDKGWTIDQIIPTGQYLAHKFGKYRFLNPGEFITAEYTGALPRENTPVTIHCSKESFTMQPVFYFAFSNEINHEQNFFTVIRFYWNIKSSGAARLIELVTKNLNKYSIPFLFKCLNNPDAFTRSDAAVLYISKPYFNISRQILLPVYSKIEGELNTDVPAFTKELRPGLGFAEDPANGESFGMSRCKIIAGAFVDAYRSGITEKEKIMTCIKRKFIEKGINVDKPYLNTGGNDFYEFDQ